MGLERVAAFAVREVFTVNIPIIAPLVIDRGLK